MHVLVCLLSLCVQPQDVPEEFRRAERAARDFLDALGVPTRGVKVVYGPIAPHEYGETEESLRRFPQHREEAMQAGRRIWMDHTMGPRPLLLRYLFHEYWHYYQQQRVGGSRYFDWAYARLGSATRARYLRNPFEREAYFIQDPLYRAYRWKERHPGGDWEAQLRATLLRTLPDLRRIWKDSPVRPKHLDRMEERLAGAHDRATGATARREIAGALTYAAGFLLKEGVEALATGDADGLAEAVAELQEPAFWGSLAVFAAAARLTERTIDALPLSRVTKGLSKAAVPLAAGMTAVQLLSGRASAKDIALSTGAYVAAGLVVSILADGVIYPALFAAGPPGWIAAGLYTIGKLAATLWVGEKLDGWLRGGLLERSAGAVPRGGPPASDVRGGVLQRIDSLRP